jgi:hypothetical protein
MRTNLLTRRRGAALVAAAGLAASAVAALPASATINSMAAGHNITVFHNIDFVAVTGWAADASLTVTVERGGVQIGTATGAASDPEATGASGLEVNHGPEGAPVAGDCWEGQTPDIQPGDVVSVTDGTTTDQVVVDNIRFTGDPRLAAGGDVIVPFVARLAAGGAVPLARIDSAEFRSTSRLRFESTDIQVQRQAGGAPGAYQMRYNAPFRPARNRDLLNQQQLRRLLLGDGHAIGFGHTDPVPQEAMLQDGLGDTPGPAPGCEAAPSAQWSVNSVAPGFVNQATLARGLTVRGVARDATGVQVSLSDNDPTTAGAPSVAANLSAGAAQNWTASFTRAQLAGLNGLIRVRATFTLAGGSFSDSTTVVKDLVAPKAPRASLASGTYNRTKTVALRSAPGNQIRYTLGNGSQARPTANNGALYRGNRIRISASQTLKAVAVDRAGNVSPLGKWRYRIR